ncbi:MAG: hypothetical protein BJ554DRAFT_4337, partial [Olpidium bornovanus]
GLVVYFRKEGRALGEVTKYLGEREIRATGLEMSCRFRTRAEHGDTAADYFRRTECIAGVKDMRFQALMPDVLHWLGIKKVDRMISMSNMKHDAIVAAGIPILERVDIPADLIPADSRVEIEAKVRARLLATTPPRAWRSDFLFVFYMSALFYAQRHTNTSKILCALFFFWCFPSPPPPLHPPQIAAGYFTTGHIPSAEELEQTKGRTWCAQKSPTFSKGKTRFLRSPRFSFLGPPP